MFSISKKLLVSIAERIPNEIYEEILVRLDVQNLLRCKSVCKSWKSLISHPRFIEAHWKRNYNNNGNGHAVFPNFTRSFGLKYYIVGSAHGLVCINSYSGDDIIVANPWTREENIFKKPHDVTQSSCCWGFGYDSLTDDYKVVLGIMELGETSFHVLSLKTNAWKHIGHVTYTCYFNQIFGTFCHGALHWVMRPRNPFMKSLIISLDLSKEVFKEIPQPDDARYEPYSVDRSLDITVGIHDECLCIHQSFPDHQLWVMKKYNVKQSWVTLGHDWQEKFEFYFEDHVVPDEKSTHDTWFSQKGASIPSTTIMQSLISPNPRAGNE